jgi:hypothetical protein
MKQEDMWYIAMKKAPPKMHKMDQTFMNMTDVHVGQP